MQRYEVTSAGGRCAAPTAPEAGSRGEAQRRTRDLIDGLGGAARHERSAIRAEVVALHLRMATAVARSHGPAGELDDLIQVARVGLVEAFDRFDPEHGTYAGFARATMTGLLQHHLRDHGWSVRPPRALQESANRLRRALPGLTQSLGRTPSTGDVADHLGWTSAAVVDAERADLGRRAVSTDALVGDGWEPWQPFEGESVETRLLLGRALRALSDDERELLRLRFVDELSQAQIGTVLGLDQVAVSRRLLRLLRRLRAEIGELDDRGR